MPQTVTGDAEPTVRPASDSDAAEMSRVEGAARALLVAHGVDLNALEVPEGLEEQTSWTLAFVAEVGSAVVGVARLTALDDELISLDQVSVHPQFAGRGVGRRLLTEVASRARQLGYTAVTGTTFRDIAFNGAFYTRLGCVEDPDPHPVMLRRREVERAIGLDRFGPRVILRLCL